MNRAYSRSILSLVKGVPTSTISHRHCLIGLRFCQTNNSANKDKDQSAPIIYEGTFAGKLKALRRFSLGTATMTCTLVVRYTN